MLLICRFEFHENAGFLKRGKISFIVFVVSGGHLTELDSKNLWKLTLFSHIEALNILFIAQYKKLLFTSIKVCSISTWIFDIQNLRAHF